MFHNIPFHVLFVKKKPEPGAGQGTDMCPIFRTHVCPLSCPKFYCRLLPYIAFSVHTDNGNVLRILVIFLITIVMIIFVNCLSFFHI